VTKDRLGPVGTVPLRLVCCGLCAEVRRRLSVEAPLGANERAEFLAERRGIGPDFGLCWSLHEGGPWSLVGDGRALAVLSFVLAGVVYMAHDGLAGQSCPLQ
jgi:hypothetical protein